MKYIGMFFILSLMFIVGISDTIIFKVKVWLTYKNSDNNMKKYLSSKDFYIYINNQRK